MPFDGLLMYALTEELNCSLLHAKVEKIYMPEPHELILSFRHKKQLYISIHSTFPRLYLSAERFENPSNPPMLCMLLRKHLVGSRIMSIEQLGLDRVLTITFQTVSDLGDKSTKSLIIEIMGKHSNAIFVESDSNRIIDSMKRVSLLMSSRVIYPGIIYHPMHSPKLNLIHSTQEDYTDFTLGKNLCIDKFIIQRYEGFSPILAREICLRSELNPKMQVDDLNLSEQRALVKSLLILKERLVHHQYTPTLYTLEKTTDFHVFPLKSLQTIQQEKSYDSISSLLSAYSGLSQQSNRIQQKSIHLHKLISSRLEKYYLKLDHLLNDLQQAESAETYQLYGELITGNLYNAPQGTNQMTVLNYYTNEELTIPLDIMLSPIDNAQLYYKKYQKFKIAKIEVNHQIEETQKEMAYLEQVLTLLENAQDYMTIDLIFDELVQTGYIRKGKTKKTMKKPKAKLLTYTSPQGTLIYIGRNNIENDQLTTKEASRNDIWLHTKNIPGSHVIIKTGGNPIDDETLLMAAQLAAAHSKAKNSTRVEVDYTEIKNVKKPSGAKPGMVIYDHYKTLVVDPIKNND